MTMMHLSSWHIRPCQITWLLTHVRWRLHLPPLAELLQRRPLLAEPRLRNALKPPRPPLTRPRLSASKLHQSGSSKLSVYSRVCGRMLGYVGRFVSVSVSVYVGERVRDGDEGRGALTLILCRTNFRYLFRNIHDPFMYPTPLD
jgi:hypothetical protein